MAYIDSCPCQGITLVRDIVDVIDLESQQKEREAGIKAKSTARRIITHLNDAESRVSASLRASVKADMAKIRAESILVQYADEPMLNFDHIRYIIHENPELHRLMVCDQNENHEQEIVQLGLVILGANDKQLKEMNLKVQDPIPEAQAMLQDSLNVLCSGK